MYVPATVHHHGHQVVQPLRVGGVSGRVEEAELQGEDDAIGQLGVALQLLHVLEALQVQRQDHRQLLDAHPAKRAARSDPGGGLGGKKRGAPTSCAPPACFDILHSSICIRCTVSPCC